MVVPVMVSVGDISGASLFRPVQRQDRPGPRADGAAPDSQDRAAPGTPANERTLTEDQRRQVQELRKTDVAVRQHEQAHKTVGGPYAGAIQYEYTTGPDGRRYVTGGEVPIDVSPVRGDPAATIVKMEVVKRAALAPQEPSPQDRQVAAQADATKAQARQELQQTRQAEAQARNAERNGDGETAAQLTAQARQAAGAYGRAGAAPAPSLFSLFA